MTEEEAAAYEEAMAMNAQLKAMMAQQQMAQQQEDRGVLQQSQPRGPRQPRQMPRGANPGKNYTFDDQKLMGMAHENQVLLSKISTQRISVRLLRQNRGI